MSTSERARRHLVPHFTSYTAWESEQLPVLVRGEGAWVWDENGTRYLDGLSGLFCVNLGHGRSDLAAVAAKQMETLAFASTWGYAHPPAVEAAELIASLAPGDLDRVFFVNSGAEAVESALKLARTFHLANGEPQRTKVIAREWAYHGVTLGGLAATGVPKVREPYAPMLGDFVLRAPNTHDRGLAAAADIEALILDAGPENVSLVLAEPVQNGGGALVPPDGYWQQLRAICDRYGVLLCADEVINAYGRLGHWFASSRFGVVPDLITFAKGVTSAYVPLGGVIARGQVLETIAASPSRTFVHGATFGSHPVATAVAVANLEAMRDEHVLDNVLSREAGLRASLTGLAAAHRCVRDVRGAGFFYALELADDGRELTDEQHAALRGGLLGRWVREARLLIRPDDRGATMLVVAPPLISDDGVLDELVAGLDQVLGRTDDWLSTGP
jgi:adenosylmethionine-8-amino-7-oxononanoate aminotransferase